MFLRMNTIIIINTTITIISLSLLLLYDADIDCEETPSILTDDEPLKFNSLLKKE